MNNPCCGLDFGTSNSTVGIIEAGSPRLVALEDDKVTLPSAIFFSFEDNQAYFGRKAIGEYIDGADGRLMRALKSVLGTSLVHDTTRIKSKAVSFIEIIGLFAGHLKAQAEAAVGDGISDVVLGRPVQFVDDDPVADAAAQGQLEQAVRAQGFKNITFQYEPIAAALDYEQQVTREQLALIVDIGGGTSDFSIVRVSPERARAVDRQADILANVGVHIGGTDFDRMLSLAKVMPLLGYKTLLADGLMDVPSAYYFDLATWQRINWLYTQRTMLELKQVRYEAQQPELIERLIAVIENRQGHALAARVEEAKVALTQHDSHALTLTGLAGLKSGFEVSLGRDALNHAIGLAVERVIATVDKTLAQAGLAAGDIQAVFLTGGSTQIPLVKQSIMSRFMQAQVVEGDMFGSVGLGLALDAQRKFG